MVSKVVLVALIAVFAQALAAPAQCPDPSAAKVNVYNELIREDAPSVGRVAKKVAIPTDGKVPSCVLLTGVLSSESQGVVSISSIGISKDGDVTVDIVSTIQRGIDVRLEVYTDE